MTLQSSQSLKTDQPMILAVDDDEDNLFLLTEVLTPINCSLITAKDGQTALKLAQECQPSLIVLDIMLPDISGIEVLQQIKQNPKTKQIPVIAVTALARQEDRDRILLSGCNDYVSKPYMVDDLEEIIRYYLPKNSCCCCGWQSF